MFRLSRLSLVAVGLSTALAVSACAPRVTTGGGQTPATGPTTPAQGQIDTSKPVTIALLAPASASNRGAAALGKALGNAARMAASDAGDPLLQVRIYDTGGNAGKARSAAE